MTWGPWRRQPESCCAALELLDASKTELSIPAGSSLTRPLATLGWDVHAFSGAAAIANFDAAAGPLITGVAEWTGTGGGEGAWIEFQEVANNGTEWQPTWVQWIGVNELIDIVHLVRGRAFRVVLTNPYAGNPTSVKLHLQSRLAHATDWIPPRAGDRYRELFTDTGVDAIADGSVQFSPIFGNLGPHHVPVGGTFPAGSPAQDHDGNRPMYQVHGPLLDWLVQTTGGGGTSAVEVRGANVPTMAGEVAWISVPVGAAGVFTNAAQLPSNGVALLRSGSPFMFNRVAFVNGSGGPISSQIFVRPGGW